MGGEEFGVIFLIALVLFGPSQLPKLARGLGEAIREFKKAQRDILDVGAAPERPQEPPEKRPDA